MHRQRYLKNELAPEDVGEWYAEQHLTGKQRSLFLRLYQLTRAGSQTTSAMSLREIVAPVGGLTYETARKRILPKLEALGVVEVDRNNGAAHRYRIVVDAFEHPRGAEEKRENIEESESTGRTLFDEPASVVERSPVRMTGTTSGSGFAASVANLLISFFAMLRPRSKPRSTAVKTEVTNEMTSVTPDVTEVETEVETEVDRGQNRGQNRGHSQPFMNKHENEIHEGEKNSEGKEDGTELTLGRFLSLDDISTPDSIRAIWPDVRRGMRLADVAPLEFTDDNQACLGFAAACLFVADRQRAGKVRKWSAYLKTLVATRAWTKAQTANSSGLNEPAIERARLALRDDRRAKSKSTELAAVGYTVGNFADADIAKPKSARELIDQAAIASHREHFDAKLKDLQSRRAQ